MQQGDDIMKNGFFGQLFDLNHDGNLSFFEQVMDVAMFDRMIRDSELEDAGLDRLDLELMDDDERREVLEDAGLDPDNYDF